MSHEIHCYEYINRPFSSVRTAILSDALRFLAPATAEAGQRAHVLARHLSVMVAGFEIGKDIDVVVERIDLHTDAPGHLAPEALEINLSWRARTQTGLFPVMNAKLLASSKRSRRASRRWFRPDATLSRRLAEGMRLAARTACSRVDSLRG